MSETDDIARAYDTVAGAYAEHFGGELDHKPVDRALLAMLAEEAIARGLPVADLGAGPGHVAAWLDRRGARAIAVDLSPEMVAQASARGVEAHAGDLRDLPLSDASLGAAAMLYAIVHLDASELPAVFAEARRVLAPGARVLVSFHVGTDRVHLTEFLGADVELTFRFFPTDAVVAAIEAAGLVVDARFERAPHVPHEHPSTRAYVLARRPSS
jgi:ubiquinone/menaquinone biosynthesis C-methylase UbiE